MGRLLYGIAEAGSDALGAAIVGVGGEPIGWVGGGLLRAAVSEVGGPLGHDEETLTAFGAVLKAIGVYGPIVPVRFGAVLGDDAAVEQLLAQRREELSAALAVARACVEFTVRWCEAAAVERPGGLFEDAIGARDGVEYLRRRASRRAGGPPVGAMADLAPVLGLALASRVDEPTAVQPHAGVTALVERDAAPAFAAAFERARGEGSALAGAVLTGPWPVAGAWATSSAVRAG